MLRHFGATVRSGTDDDGTHIVELEGEATLTAADIAVPRDPSSAASDGGGADHGRSDLLIHRLG